MRLSVGEDPRLKAQFTRRALLLGLGQIGLFGVLGRRLYELQVVDGEHYGDLAVSTYASNHLIMPERGRVFDRFGTLLATDVPGLRAVIVPYLAGDVGAVIERVRTIVPVSDQEAERIVRLARRQNKRLPILIASNLTWEQVTRINLLAPELPGLMSEPSYRRHYLHGADVGHLIGYLGSPDKMQAEDDPVFRVPGVKVGRSGIELGLDRHLRGEAGRLKLEMNGATRTIKQVDVTPPRPGSDIVLTLDLDMQRRAISLLSPQRRAALVALDVNTGGVIALVSHPAFDNTSLANGISETEWDALQGADDDPLTNRAVRGLYPPGSTFKMVTALAGLESRHITLQSRVTCTGSYELAGQRFGCWNRSGHGSLDLHNALKRSCDVFFYETAQRVGIDGLAAMARKLGLGMTFDQLPLQQKAGVVPNNDWKIAKFEKRWYTGETLLAGIGQGYMLVTPLHLAVMAARLACGRQIAPHITLATRMAGGDDNNPPQMAVKNAPVEAPPLGIDPAHLAAIRKGMSAAVNEEGGTAGSAALDLKGVLLAGKTGTAQVSGLSHSRAADDLPWQQRDHSLFVAFAPAGKPRYAIAVICEHAGGGAKVAAPIARAMMTALLDRDPLAHPAFVAPIRSAPGATPSQPGGMDAQSRAAVLKGETRG